MRIKGLVDEDFVNYKKPSMFIGTISCGGKCCNEMNLPLSVCQNDGWRESAPIEINDKKLIERYDANPITKAIVFGGLEPFEQYQEIEDFIYEFRGGYGIPDDIVIYTGYYPEEIKEQIETLKLFNNIIIKFGRYIPGRPSRYDDVLGVTLISDNQFAERLQFYGDKRQAGSI